MKRGHKRLFAAVFLSPVLIFVIFICTGCGAKEGDEPTKYRSQAGLEKLSMQQAQTSPDNTKFLSSRSITPNTMTSKDIDSIIRPVLINIFKDVKLISTKGPQAPKTDGEVVEDQLIYSVKTILTQSDGDKLHGAFRAAGFPSSPRLGSKPTHGRNNVVMSLFRSTSQRGYSFVINVDLVKQQIEVESYRLGSKYDRLM